MREDLDVDKVRVTYQETPYWSAEEFRENLPRLKDPLVRLLVHLLFILSGRPGEPAGIQLDSVNLAEKWIHIRQSLTRVKENSLERTDPRKIFFVFPKVKQSSTSVLVLKCPKTEMSVRAVRITKQLAEEIEARMRHIHHCKQLYGDAYQDYNLLICQDNGRPYDVRNLQRHFRKCIEEAGIENRITLRGLRKSSLIYKNNLTGNDYTLVMKDSGHTQVGTLIKHYDDVNDQERVQLAHHIEDDLYEPTDSEAVPAHSDEIYEDMMQRILSDPEKAMLLMRAIASKPSLLRQMQQ
jgi:integrase